jgi:hypothetical protein
VIEMLKQRYRVQDVIDYSGLEHDGVYLEGTGAMVLGHIERTAHAARSNRSSEVALERFCTHFNFEPVVFDADDAAGRPIYHTNVLMCVGTDVCQIGLATIRDSVRRAEIAARLNATGRAVIDLSHQQIGEFVGNAIELQGRSGRIVAMSARALKALQPQQLATLQVRDHPAAGGADHRARRRFGTLHARRNPLGRAQSRAGRRLRAGDHDRERS